MQQLNFSVFTPVITKEYLFSKGINQESIFKYYTGLTASSKKLVVSPFRHDNHPTCGFYKSKAGILYLHDFATNEHINCFEAVMRLYNCNYYSALDKIAIDFKIIDGISTSNKIPIIVDEIEPSETSKIQVQIKEFSDDELEWWNSFGITKEMLKKYHVYSIKHIFLNGNLTFSSNNKCPIYGYYFGKDKNGFELWKCYFPLKENNRFIGNLNKKVLQGYKQLPKTGNLLVITKSMKDVICLNRFKIPACAPNSETLFISDKQLEEFKQRFKHILVIYDNDRPGLFNLAKIRRKYPELNYYFLPKNLAKDFTDSVKIIGINKMQELINQFMSNYKFK